MPIFTVLPGAAVGPDWAGAPPVVPPVAPPVAPPSAAEVGAAAVMEEAGVLGAAEDTAGGWVAGGVFAVSDDAASSLQAVMVSALITASPATAMVLRLVRMVFK
ncbi:hypothetical protein ABTZ03_33420 [Kitasatospora sp. NPDC096077]|uniref:hypothetical protein n=1 Tax=Kitasatospora sp. NPDC096077 TaxID=3155544 RepID=UPI00332DEB75